LTVFNDWIDPLIGRTNFVQKIMSRHLVFAILYNLVRLVILHSATQQQVEGERISFLDALRWLRAPGTGIPLEALCVNPARPNRMEPRVTKRRPTAFPFMTKPRRVLRQALIQQALGD
jgi:hypothetical protein